MALFFLKKVPLKPRAKDMALAGWRVPKGMFQVRAVGPEEAGRRLRSGGKEAGLGYISLGLIDSATNFDFYLQATLEKFLFSLPTLCFLSCSSFHVFIIIFFSNVT